MKLQLIQYKKTPLSQVIAIIYVIALILMFTSVFIWSPKLSLLFLSICIITTISLPIIKTYEITGTIELTANEIIIHKNGNRLVFQLMKMKRIEVRIREIAGQSRYGGLCLKLGMDNYLTFNIAGEKKKYMFLFQEELVKELRQTLWSWHYAGLPLFLYNFPAEN